MINRFVFGYLPKCAFMIANRVFRKRHPHCYKDRLDLSNNYINVQIKALSNPTYS